MPETKFEAQLPAWQKMLISLVLIVVVVISAMVWASDVLSLEVLGVFIQICGVLLLTVGLVRTNDDLVKIANHPKQSAIQPIVTHLATERFQIMLALFLMVLGMLLEIFSAIFV